MCQPTSNTGLLAECRDLVGSEIPRLATVLAGGPLATALTAVGTGFSSYAQQAVTRWDPDPTRDTAGYFIYLRDLESRRYWSLSRQPIQGQPTSSSVCFFPGYAEFIRVEAELESTMTVWVTTEGVEFRRCRLRNLAGRTRHLELTSYLEFVLTNAEADQAHPAFSKLFIETHFDRQQQAILARRRPRERNEATICGVHFLAGQGSQRVSPEISFETDRKAFLGRGRGVSRPLAMETLRPLPGTVGSVLDPIGSLRQTFSLTPDQSIEVTFALAARTELDELTRLVEQWQRTEDVAKSLSTVAAAEAARWSEWCLSELQQSWVLQTIGRSLFGDEPLAGEFLGEHVPVSPEIVTGDLQTWMERTVRLAPDRLQPPAAEPLPAAGNLGGAASTNQLPYRPAVRTTTATGGASSDGGPALLFDNGRGGFSPLVANTSCGFPLPRRKGRALPPMPWSNVIANEQAGFITTETGAGYTWAGNSRLNRLTPWTNDPVSDPHGEAFYLRDETERTFWSPLPGPAPGAGDYEVRHGFGYTCFRHSSQELAVETVQFVPTADPVKITRISITNTGDHPRRLSLFSYLQWVLGDASAQTRRQIVTRVDEPGRTILALNPHRPDYGKQVAFAAAIPWHAVEATAWSVDRASFLGRYGDVQAPRALCQDEMLAGDDGQVDDPCAAWQLRFDVNPGEAVEAVFLLGEAESEEAVRTLVLRYGNVEGATSALQDVHDFWRDFLSQVEIETPSQSLNLLVGGWLPYQNLSCRMWGRSAYFQSGGAFGFRDQLQDAAALMYHAPELTRKQILLHASHQFEQGDVMHWWHPPRSLGLRTRFSDDLLWLPWIASYYVDSTGDQGFWDESVRFLTGPPLAEGVQESFIEPRDAGTVGSLFEHCCRAIDISLTRGLHGLPLMGCGDWNDGMNRVGSGGQGESVWLGFFLYLILGRFAALCEERREADRVKRYVDYRRALGEALNKDGWDGQWYRRAFFDDGTPIGSAQNEECQIDALAQAWSVLSKAAPPDRAALAMQAVEERLVRDDDRMIRLLAPPFNRTPQDPGYIQGYLPGIRENGGQYTHGVLWFVQAMAQLGHGSRAVELLEMLCPTHHTRTPAEVAIYQTEPYVVAADVYGEPPHVGRGGWTWYTGSAGWMSRVTLESIFGLRLQGGRSLRIDPCISSAWPRCQLWWRLPDRRTPDRRTPDRRTPDRRTRYQVVIENPHGAERGITRALLDDRTLPVEEGVANVPLLDDGRDHRVCLWL